MGGEIDDLKRSLEKKFVEKRPPLAYAKLSGRLGEDEPFQALITQLPVELGRGKLAGPQQSNGTILLGEQKAISRLHARIEWSSSKSCFQLICLGKNGLFAGGKFVPPDTTIDLSSRMPLKIGQARVYFLAAIRSTCSTMSGARLVQRAFEKAKSMGQLGDGLTIEQIALQIHTCYPKSETELGGRDNVLEFISTFMELEKQIYTQVEGSNPPRYIPTEPKVTEGPTLKKQKVSEAT